MKERQSIMRNFRWLAGTNLAVKPLWLFFLFYSARVLGPNQFGEYMLALSYVSLVYSILEGGIDIFTVRELSTGRKEFQHLFPNTMFIKAVSGLGTVCVVIILSMVLLSSTVPSIILIYGGLYIVAYSLTTHARYIFRAFEVLKYEAISIFIEKIAVVSLCLLALLLEKSAVIFMAAFSIGYLITCVVTLFILLKKIGLPQWRITWKYLWNEVILPALPYALMSFLMVVYFRSATVMIKLLIGNEGIIGYYNAGYRLVEAFVLFPSMVIAPLYPVFARRNAEKSYIGTLALNSTRIITVVSLSICLLFILLSREFTQLVYGEEFLPAVNAIRFLPIAMVPIGLTWVFGTLVAASGRQWRANFYLLGITIANIVGHLIMIPSYGLMGAISVTLATECAVAITNIWIMRDYINYEFLLLLLKFTIPPVVLYLFYLANIIFGSFILKLLIVFLILSVIYVSLRLISLREIKNVFSSKS